MSPALVEAKKWGLVLKDPKCPELGWRLVAGGSAFTMMGLRNVATP